jgi:hypothetical protein
VGSYRGSPSSRRRRTNVPHLTSGKTGDDTGAAPERPGRPGESSPVVADGLSSWGAHKREGTPSVSLFPCSGCGERVPEKLAQATWAWNLADGSRVAYRQRLCLACYASVVLPLGTKVAESLYTCPLCGGDPGDDMDPVYLTVFTPGIGKGRLEMATCSACAVEIRTRARSGAVKLDDRPMPEQTPGPRTDVHADPWAALGLKPDD